MADADVRIRMGVTAADLSGLDALTTKSESLRKAISGLSGDLAAAERRMAALPTTTAAARPGAATAPPVPTQAPARVEQARLTLPGPMPTAAPAPTPRLGQMTQADAFAQAPARVEQARLTLPGPMPTAAPTPRLGQMTQADAFAQAQRVSGATQIQEVTASQREVDQLLAAVRAKQSDLDRKLDSLKSQDSARQREATITGEPLVPRPTPLVGAPGVPPTPAPVLQEMRASRTEQTQESAREHEKASRERRQETLQGALDVERPRAAKEAPPVAPVSQQVQEGQQVRVAAATQRHVAAAVPIDLSGAAQRFALMGTGTMRQGRPQPQPMPGTLAQRLVQFGQNLFQGSQPQPTTAQRVQQNQRIAQSIAAATAPPPSMSQFLQGGPPTPSGPTGPPPAPGQPGAVGGRVAGAARGAAGFVGRALIGGGVGAIVGAGIGIIASPLIGASTAALERYEQRVRSVGQMSMMLGGAHQEINASLDEMREKYKFLASEGLEAMSGILESGKPLQGQLKTSTEAALGFARAYGVTAQAAGRMQGQMERVFARPAAGQFPIADIEGAQRRYRYAGSTPEQFVQQAIQIGGIGGYNAPTPSTAFGARWTDFIGGMGQRFVNNQAAFAQEFAANLAPGAGGEQTEALRQRAIAGLAESLPGGKLTIGAGDEARTLDLRGSYRDRLIALEQAPTSPQIWEAFAQQGEKLGRNAVEQAELIRTTLAPNMPRFTIDKLLEQRAKAGPGGFLNLEKELAIAQGKEPKPGEKTAGDQMVPERLQNMEKTYADLLGVGAKIDGRMEKWGATLLQLQIDAQKGLLAGADWLEKIFRGNETSYEKMSEIERNTLAAANSLAGGQWVPPNERTLLEQTPTEINMGRLAGGRGPTPSQSPTNPVKPQ